MLVKIVRIVALLFVLCRRSARVYLSSLTLHVINIYDYRDRDRLVSYVLHAYAWFIVRKQRLHVRCRFGARMRVSAASADRNFVEKWQRRRIWLDHDRSRRVAIDSIVRCSAHARSTWSARPGCSYKANKRQRAIDRGVLDDRLDSSWPTDRAEDKSFCLKIKTKK